jgi:hypothetical protein
MTIGIDGFLHERIEQLYVCDEYRLFFLTGQPNSTSQRRAFISVRPFHSFDADTLATMKAEALPWTEAESRIQITPLTGTLAFRDGLTGTVTNVPPGELDAEVQRRLGAAAGASPWQKYGGGPSVRTADSVMVGTPLRLKKTPGFNL